MRTERNRLTAWRYGLTCLLAVLLSLPGAWVVCLGPDGDMHIEGAHALCGGEQADDNTALTAATQVISAGDCTDIAVPGVTVRPARDDGEQIVIASLSPLAPAWQQPMVAANIGESTAFPHRSPVPRIEAISHVDVIVLLV